VVDLGQQLGVDDLNAQDVQEALGFESQNLDNEDLFELKEQLKIDENEVVQKPTELTSKLLNEIIQNFQFACDFAKENDPNEVRSSKVINNVIDDIQSYTEEAKEKLKNSVRQSSMNDFFSPN
jgi:hypothetical protein